MIHLFCFYDECHLSTFVHVSHCLPSVISFIVIIRIHDPLISTKAETAPQHGKNKNIRSSVSSIHQISFYDECCLHTFFRFIVAKLMLYHCIVIIRMHVILIYTKAATAPQQRTVENTSTRVRMLLSFLFSSHVIPRLC